MPNAKRPLAPTPARWACPRSRRAGRSSAARDGPFSRSRSSGRRTDEGASPLSGPVLRALVALGLSILGGDPCAAIEDGPPPPLPWQEPAPLARLFLELPFEGPQPLPERELEMELRLLYSNSLLSARNEAFALFIHVETAEPTLLVRYGLGSGIEAEAALPLVLDYGGFLDGPIDVVEGFFDAANPQRKGLARNVARYELTRPDGGGIVRDGADLGLGDAWLALKVALPARPLGADLALRAALKLPTGRLPFGSEEVDVGFGLLAGLRFPRTALALEVDALVPTAASLPAVHIETRPYGALDLGLTEELARRVALQLQASLHLSPLAGTGLDEIDDATAYVLAGVTLALSRGTRLEVGVIENVLNPYRGADITFLLGLASGAVRGHPPRAGPEPQRGRLEAPSAVRGGENERGG